MTTLRFLCILVSLKCFEMVMFEYFSTEPAFNGNFTTDGGFIQCPPLVKRNVLVSVELY